MNQSRPGEQNLEMNHTNFILLDDGTLRHYEIGDYRTRLTKTIANGRAKQVLPGIFEYCIFEFLISIFFLSTGCYITIRRWRRLC